ncbi:hypothetical protein [Sorangium sp. So ce1099]|uniref:hypothetical protein n=1 Tax=Sorangium sp. So ce1099 TaxID=3133331 RepID=UPI003F6457B5
MSSCNGCNPSPPEPTPSPPPVAACPLCDIEIVDQTGTVVSETQNRMVGQRIQLRVRAVSPPGGALTNIQWTIAAETVKTYTQSKGIGTRTNLSAADLQADNVSFYWISGTFAGENKTVTVNATVQGVAKTKTVTFTVFRPRMDSFTTTASSVNICVGNYPWAPGATVIAAYLPPSTVGIEWNAQVTAPAGGSGKVAFTQLINKTRTIKPNVGPMLRNSSGGAYVLDDGAGIQYNRVQAIAAGGSTSFDWATTGSGDSPSTTLTATMMATSLDLAFRLYLMYKPDGADSIWVTLGSATWSCTGQTTRIGAPAATTNNWNAPAGAGIPHTNGSDSTVLPEWTGQATATKWV